MLALELVEIGGNLLLGLVLFSDMDYNLVLMCVVASMLRPSDELV